MKTVAISEFKAKCLDLITKMDKTKKPMVITKNGKPVAKLVPFKSNNNLKSLRGKVKYYGDIISPIEEDWNAEK
jgi:prevent-host-death family protein